MVRLSQCVVAYLLFLAFYNSVNAEPRTNCPGYSGAYTKLHRNGPGLCWDDQALRLIGYYSFGAVTRDTYDDGDSSNDPDPQYDYTSYLNSLQFVAGSVSTTRNKRHGVNFTRVALFGGSGTLSGCLVDPIIDPGKPTTRVPFKSTNGDCSPNNTNPKFTMCITPRVCGGSKFDPARDTEQMDDLYFDRLKDVLNKAKENGIIVELTLFERLNLEATEHGIPRYFYSPFNPYNNNMDDRPIFQNGNGGYGTCKVLPTAKQPFDGIDALPEFFDICADKSGLQSCKRSLNCLGIIQKKYVEKVVSAVKSSKATNVFLEVMNEAHLEDFPPPTAADWHNFALWHEVVAQWIKDSSNDELLVSASVFVGGEDQYDLMNNCKSPNNCDSEFRVYYNNNIDIVSLKGRSWKFVGPCVGATTALQRFGKPVIIDTDGVGDAIKNDQCAVLNLAREATANDQNGHYCRPRGEVHFNQLDGITMGRGNVNETYLDCKQIDLLGDAAPTRLSDIILPNTKPDSCGSKTDPIAWKFRPCTYSNVISKP